MGFWKFRGDEKWIRGSAETSVVSHSAWNFETTSPSGDVCRDRSNRSGLPTLWNTTGCLQRQQSTFLQMVGIKRGSRWLQGDICESTVVEQLAQHHPMIVSGGVSCQPFSELGDKKEQHDDRSRSFTGVLQAAI